MLKASPQMDPPAGSPGGAGETPCNIAEQRYRRELVRLGRALHARHYVSSTDGNLSVRLDDDRLLITPTQLSKRLLRPADIVMVDMKGVKISGSRDASTEIKMHLTIYKMRQDIRAVVHAHPCTATGFASMGLALTEALCSELVLTLGEVPLAPYALPGSDELSESLHPFIHTHDAITMENHGVVAYGATLEEAYLNMEAVEHCARIAFVTKVLGGAKTLGEKEVSSLLALRAKRKATAQNGTADLA